MSDDATRLGRIVSAIRRQSLAVGAAEGLGLAGGLAAVGWALGGLWPALGLAVGGLGGMVARRWLSADRAVALADARWSMSQALTCAWDRRALGGAFEIAQRRRALTAAEAHLSERVISGPRWAWCLPLALWAWPAVAPPAAEVITAEDAGVVEAAPPLPDAGAVAARAAEETPEGPALPAVGEGEPEREDLPPEAAPVEPDAALPIYADAGVEGEGPDPDAPRISGEVAGVGNQAGRLSAGGAGTMKIGPEVTEGVKIELRPAPLSPAEARAMWLAAGERRGLTDPARRWPPRHQALIRAWADAEGASALREKQDER